MRSLSKLRPWLRMSWLLLWSSAAMAQVTRPNATRQPDAAITISAPEQLTVSTAAVSTASIFSVQTFYEFVRQHHPLVKQASLFNDEARQGILQARGAFDPKLMTYYDRKEFGQDLYFDHWQSKLTVPLWLGGADLTVSYDRNDPRGSYLNPEERTPSSGLTGVGLTLPVGQTMLIDARRNTLRQARLMQTVAEADRRKQVNKILFDAAKTYWAWFLAYRQRRLLSEGYELAERRFQGLRQRALLGDAAPIDTTEALITVQDRLIQQQQADVAEQNARLVVSTFLWNAGGQPVDLPDGAVPQEPLATPPDEAQLETLLGQDVQQHPELLKLGAKSGQLALEERFRRAMIQPQILLSAMLLSETPRTDVPYNWSSYYALRPQNHKISVDVVFPLFLRKERGKLREVQLKNQQVALEQQQVGRDIANVVQTTWNELKALERLISVQEQTVTQQRTLLRAEQQKFDLGESSLFLVNSRESKLIDLQVKREELRTKYGQTVAALWYAAGLNAGDR